MTATTVAAPKRDLPPTHVDVVRVHSSGNHFVATAHPKRVARYLARLARKHAADILTTTEARDVLVPELQRILGPAWRVDIIGEFLVAWRHAVVQTDRKRWRLETLTDTPGAADWRQMKAAVVPFELVLGGRELWELIYHGPAGIQRRRGWNLTSRRHRQQVQTAREGFPALGTLAAEIHAQEKPEGRPVTDTVGDTNMSARLQWVRLFLHRHLEGRMLWRNGRLPLVGTHAGGRVIDNAVVLGAKILRAAVSRIPRPRRYDHGAIVYTLRIPIKRQALVRR